MTARKAQSKPKPLSGVSAATFARIAAKRTAVDVALARTVADAETVRLAAEAETRAAAEHAAKPWYQRMFGR